MTNKREFERKSRLNSIIETIKPLIENNIEINDEALCSEIMMDFGVTRRTAVEYISTAKYGAKAQIEKNKARERIEKKEEEDKPVKRFDEDGNFIGY